MVTILQTSFFIEVNRESITAILIHRITTAISAPILLYEKSAPMPDAQGEKS